jgi:biopolymer transport protein ExbB
MADLLASMLAATGGFQQTLVELLEGLQDYFETGGNVLYVILAIAFFLWLVLIERFLFFRYTSPRQIRAVVDKWNARADKDSWHAKHIRSAMIAEQSVRLRQWLVLAQTLVALCPLCGILGTVTGMIAVFEVMAFQGGGNARGLAAGISQATLPTMSGLVVAISGLYFVALIERQANRETERLSDQLR